MTKEVEVRRVEDGLEFSEHLSPEELATVIDRLSRTYCNDPDCYMGRTSKCESCVIGNIAHEMKEELLGEGNH